ncbi:MAG: hypothetical protein JNJ52_12520, partial [Flavobacterium sp.]|nr:hypothetical protein [Flavobacterium sp.]
MKVKITLLLTTLVFLVLATKSNAQEQKSNEQGISKKDILKHYLSQIKLDSIALSKETSFGENKNGTNVSTSVQDNQDAGPFWRTNGNFDTDSDVNFVGTTDNEDLTFRRNNVISGRLGFLNTSYGYLSGRGGFSNVNIGRKAGNNSNLIQNFYNISIGESAGLSNETGSLNTFVGVFAGTNNTSGIGNTFIGADSGRFNTTGNSNTAIGFRSLLKNTTGDYNISLSNGALENNTTGNHNIAIGSWSMQKNEIGDDNIGIGHSAGQFSTGSHNIFFGEAAGKSIESGDNNLFLGYYTGHFLNQGSENIFIGSKSGYSTTVGIKNLFLGNSSGVINGSNNIAIGENAGGNTGNGNILIGNNSKINPGFQQNPLNNNFLNIGNVVFGYNMNRISSADNTTTRSGMIGINTTAPKTALEVNSEIKDVSGLRFTNLKSNYNPTNVQPTNKFLTVNQDGDVVLQYMANLNTTNVLESNGNTMTTNVNTITSSAPIINSIANSFNSSNELITTVNGVSSNPITIPIPNFIEIDGSVTNELQTLSQSGNTITLSNNGGSFTLPTFTDTDAQALTLTGNNLSISNGNTVLLPTTNVIAGTNVSVTGNGSTASPFQISAQDEDEQNLTLVGNNLSISNGNTVVLPTFTEIDGSVTNELQTLTQTGNTVTLSNNGGSFTLPTDTDNQTLTLTGNTLSIADGNSVVLPTTNVIAGTNVTVI